MADTNITSLLVETPSRFEFQQPYIFKTFEIDVLNADYTGIETTGTHNIYTIPQGMALVGAKLITTTAFTSAGSATIQFAIGSDNMTGVIPIANLAAGDCVDITLSSTTSTTTTAGYADTADDTFDMTVGTAALTAGAFVLIVQLVDVTSVTTRG